MPRSTEQTALLERLLVGIERELPAAVALRHTLHELPELAHAEERTAATVARALPVQSATVAGTGRIARVGGGDGPAVAVRAELDGLPIEERTGAPFSARGGAMHACGHDVHMAALVALTRAAHALGEQLPMPLLAVLQPSEEAYPSGAQELADGASARTDRGPVGDGASARTARGPVGDEASGQTARGPLAELAPARTARGPLGDEASGQTARGPLAVLAPAAIVAAHVHPELRWGTVALDEGAVNASCDAVEIVVEGEPTHGAYPHHGRDPILALAQIVVALHAQVGRRIDPLHPATLAVSVMEGGSAENVIPPRARAKGALRAHRPQDRLALRELVEEVAQGIAAAHGCRGSIALTPGEPALENDPRIVARARELLGSAGLRRASEWRSCGSDDFAFFARLAPIAMAFVGLDGAAGFERRPLHHPELLVPDIAVEAVARVQAILYVAAARALQP
jgi:metal-dependent amidase/aminoacylase/carboxypeptidase family protein